MQFAVLFKPLRLVIALAACFAGCGGDVDPDQPSGGEGGAAAGEGGRAGARAGAQAGASGGSSGGASGGTSGAAGTRTGGSGGGGTSGGSGAAGSAVAGSSGQGGSAGSAPDAGAPDASAPKDAGTVPNVGDPSTPWKLLFVGNSFTFNSGIAGKTKELVNRGGGPVTVQTSDLSVNWYRGLYYHWHFGNNVSGGNTRELIKARKYTHVVLQDFMLHTNDTSKPNTTTGEGTYGLATSSDYSKRMIDEVRMYGQIPVVWSLFPEQGKQGDFEQLILAYRKIAADNGAVFVPASAAWYLALKERPGLPLWDQDRFHPSGMGGYALACVFYAVFTGKTPVGNMFVSDNIDAATAKFLQEKAWQAYQTYGIR